MDYAFITPPYILSFTGILLFTAVASRILIDWCIKRLQSNATAMDTGLFICLCIVEGFLRCKMRLHGK